jgi:hypothetical protein|tara:strand:+ start:811 stop:990 length:180 start_codon:yes stop_codon:yes gene_type:complete
MTSKWFCIRARDMDIFKPDGKVITFWLWGKDEMDILKKVIMKDMIDIEWIGEGKPSFDD